MPVSRILVTAGDRTVAALRVRALEARGHECRVLDDPQDWAATLARFDPQLVVLDAAPGPWSEWVLDARAHSDAGLIALDSPGPTGATGRGRPRVDVDRRLPPGIGQAQFVAACESLLEACVPRRRTAADGVELHADRLLAFRGQATIEISPMETKLLAALMDRRGWPVSKQRLLNLVWGWEGYDPNLVEVHVSTLRRRLDAHGPPVIFTVRGRGYRFGAPAPLA